jgi:Na+/H+ antiporter NhaD/arsenite permease-like protein
MNSTLSVSGLLPLWSLLPFAGVLLSVALLPTVTPRFWRKYHILVLCIFAMPILSMSAALNYHWLVEAFTDYVSFICLLGALVCIGGGIYVQGAPKANPVVNLGYLVVGALLASIIGTLGASMLLIRPLLRSNRGRKHEIHVIVFFIFIVSNVAGILTPLGDPPLFLGFLAGVPFFWTLKLFPNRRTLRNFYGFGFLFLSSRP